VTIGKKLLVGGGILVACVVATGSLGIVGLNSLRADLAETTNRTTRKLELAHQMKEEVARLMLATRSTVLASAVRKDKDLQTEQSNFQAADGRMQADIREIRPLLVVDRGRKAVAQVEASLDRFRAGFEQTARLSTAYKAMEADAARQVNQLPHAMAMNKAAEEVLAIQRELMSQQASEADRNAARFRWFTLLLIAVSLTAGLAIFLVVRSVNRSLSRAVAELSQGATQVAGAS